jgi:uncharacterized protein
MTLPALTEAELDRLETLLDDPSLEDAMRLDEMQGFLCAALAGPTPIPEDERLLEILGSESQLTSPAASEAIDLIKRLSATVEAQLLSDDGLTLFLYPKGEALDAPSDFEPWCMAYLHGVDVAAADWFDDLDEEEAEFVDERLFPLMVLSGEAEGAAKEHHETWPEGEEKAELERDCEDGLPTVVEEIFRFWHTKQNSGNTLRREAPKVGRNDPCPCGSGKKYKQCCGQE